MSTKDDKKAGKKKNKANKDKNKDKLSQVDKTFYELTIADLNKKIARLRSELATLEDSNINVTEQIRSLNEDRVDIAAHLERSLIERNEVITELEDRLVEMKQLRVQERRNFDDHIKDLQTKQKTMHDQLTSEIKLLNSKLNSLDEFRVQRENLFCKVNDLEESIKEKERTHQEVLFKIEQKTVVEGDLLKREVEEKLLQVSEDFTRSSEIRNAGYTRRLIRENIALQKEINVLILAQMKMHSELKEQIERHKNMVEQYSAVDKLKNQLIYSSKNKISIVDKLCANYECLKKKYTECVKYKTLYENAKKRDICERLASKDASKKMRTLIRKLEQVKLENRRMYSMHKRRESEVQRLSMGMQQIKACIISAINLKREEEDTRAGNVNSDEARNVRNAKRHDLLNELMTIINQNEKREDICTSVSTVSNSYSTIYRPGHMGLISGRNASLMEIFKRSATAPSQMDTTSDGYELYDSTSRTNPPGHDWSNLGSIVDVESGTSLCVSSSQEHFEMDGGKAEANIEEVDEEQLSNGLSANDSKLERKSLTKSNGEPNAVNMSISDEIEYDEEASEVPQELQRSYGGGFPNSENDEFDINLFY